MSQGFIAEQVKYRELCLGDRELGGKGSSS